MSQTGTRAGVRRRSTPASSNERKIETLEADRDNLLNRVRILEALNPNLAGGTYPMQYDLLQPESFANGMDSSTAFFFRTVLDKTYPFDYYVENYDPVNPTDPPPDTAEIFWQVRVGPQGSLWGINMYAEVGPDCGTIDWAWGYLPLQEDAPASLGLINSQGIMDEGQAAGMTFYTAAAGEPLDLYSAVQNKSAYTSGIQQFVRFMGTPGTPLSADATDDADPGYNFNGGPGLYTLRLRVNGKNASSSGYKVRLTGMKLRRFNAIGYPTT